MMFVRLEGFKNFVIKFIRFLLPKILILYSYYVCGKIKIILLT